MDSYEDYRKRLREAADYAFYYGAATFGIDRIKAHPPITWNIDMQEEFMIVCHDGFKKAQKVIIEQVLTYQTELRDTRLNLKEFRRQRDKTNVKESENKIAIIERRIHNFSHIADGIAWQLLAGQIHIARRFHLQIDASKFLDSSNLNHGIAYADQINQIPLHFALLSDLTSFIHIGDLLVKKKENLSIVELKEGIVNDSISQFLKDQDRPIDEITEEELNGQFDAKTVEQVRRMQRQIKRGKQAIEVINNDKGTDPATGRNISINTPTIRTETYYSSLHQLYSDLKTKTWAYNIIDGCIHIGMYRDEGILLAQIIEPILKEKTDNYIVVDWLSITENLSEPIFSKPFPPEFIIDIMTGKVKVVMGVDFDKLIELFNLLGLPANWMSKKDTEKNKQKIGGKSVVVINHRAISYKRGEEVALLGGGIISKLLYDCILPSNMALSLLSANKDEPSNAQSEDLKQI